jgi:hypothetical protein
MVLDITTPRAVYITVPGNFTLLTVQKIHIFLTGEEGNS